MRNVMWRMRISTEEMAQWTDRATTEGKTVSQLVREVMAGYLVYAGGERRPAGAAPSGSSERATPPTPSEIVSKIASHFAAKNLPDLAELAAYGTTTTKPMEDFLPTKQDHTVMLGLNMPCARATCGHPRRRHGGWGTCCQEDNCLCPKFE